MVHLSPTEYKLHWGKEFCLFGSLWISRNWPGEVPDSLWVLSKCVLTKWMMDGWIWWGAGGGFQRNVITPEGILEWSVWVKKEYFGKRMSSSWIVLGKSHFYFLFLNMKLMHHIPESVMSHETKIGIQGSWNEPRMVQADARWEKIRGTVPFSITTR